MNKKCDSYYTRKHTRYLDPATVAYITGEYPENNGVVEYKVGYCTGTKNQEDCNCGGDRTRCDFYPEVRERAEPEPKYHGPKTLHKQLIFDCAMELIYHTERMTDEDVGNKLMDILKAMDEADDSQ